MSKPLVTCMMMTGKGPGRAWMAQMAALSFTLQSYPNKQLVIINQSKGLPHEYRVTDGEALAGWGDSVEEILIERPSTLGAMRNQGLEAADGEWLLSWDDDDWQHEERIASMMRQRRGKKAVLPTSHVRFSFPQGTAYCYHNPGGCGGLMLFPRTGSRYAEMERGEDSRFVNNFHDRLIVWENRRLAHLYLRFFHGGNIGNASHIMRKYAEAKWRGRWVGDATQSGFLSVPSAAYLKGTLVKRYGVKFPEKMRWGCPPNPTVTPRDALLT